MRSLIAVLVLLLVAAVCIPTYAGSQTVVACPQVAVNTVAPTVQYVVPQQVQYYQVATQVAPVATATVQVQAFRQPVLRTRVLLRDRIKAIRSYKKSLRAMSVNVQATGVQTTATCTSCTQTTATATGVPTPAPTIGQGD